MTWQLNDIARCYAEGLPGQAAQRPWSPRLAYGRHYVCPRRGAVREAAVAVLIYPLDEELTLALIRRPAATRHHPGQIALPGGRVERGEGSAEAMRRELAEELGVMTRPEDSLGPLSPIHVFNSGFWMQPWLVLWPERPSFVIAEAEVAELIEFPLSAVLAAQPSTTCRIDRWGRSWRAPCFAWHGYDVWGATSLVLGELQALLSPLPG